MNKALQEIEDFKTEIITDPGIPVIDKDKLLFVLNSLKYRLMSNVKGKITDADSYLMKESFGINEKGRTVRVVYLGTAQKALRMITQNISKMQNEK